eukprot:2559482-Rhodomonas_salina.1
MKESSQCLLLEQAHLPTNQIDDFNEHVFEADEGDDCGSDLLLGDECESVNSDSMDCFEDGMEETSPGICDTDIAQLFQRFGDTLHSVVASAVS